MENTKFISVPLISGYKFSLQISVRLKSFESVLCLSGPVGALSQSDVDVLKTAIAKQLIQPPVTGKGTFYP